MQGEIVDILSASEHGGDRVSPTPLSLSSPVSSGQRAVTFALFPSSWGYAPWHGLVISTHAFLRGPVSRDCWSSCGVAAFSASSSLSLIQPQGSLISFQWLDVSVCICLVLSEGCHARLLSLNTP